MGRRHPIGNRTRNYLIALHLADQAQAKLLSRARKATPEEWDAMIDGMNQHLDPRYGVMDSNGEYCPRHSPLEN